MISRLTLPRVRTVPIALRPATARSKAATSESAPSPTRSPPIRCSTRYWMPPEDRLAAAEANQALPADGTVGALGGRLHLLRFQLLVEISKSVKVHFKREGSF